MNPRVITLLCLALLIAWQLTWHAWLVPAGGLALLIWLLLAVLPLLLCAAAVLARRANGLFWSGVVALPYFCHGVMEAWAAAEPLRPWALIEALIAISLVLAVGIEGWQRRQAAKAQTKNANPL